MIRTIVLVLVAEIWNTLGQVFFKKATNSLEQTATKKNYASFLGQVMRMPEIAFGLASMAIGLVAWLAALSNSDLSLVFPLGSVQYLLIFLASRFFLSEKIDAMRALGTFLIGVGIALIALSGAA